MSNSYFQFKKFTVFQDKCAMKVGTDGVLLGAWADINHVSTALDVGAGTGLISLMLAQRADNSIEIDAIDIDADAVMQARENIEQSPFDNINCNQLPFAEYVPKKSYDLIVSNPPFFTRSLHSPDHQRTLARHTNSLPLEDFFQHASSLLSETGHISLINPFINKNVLISLAKINQLHIVRVTNVYPTPQGVPKRVLMEFSKTRCDCVETDLILELERHVYSLESSSLFDQFYLKM